MSRPKAYEPVQGYMYQILLWNEYNREYDHLDYAVDKKDYQHLMKEYRLLYKGKRMKTERFPQKCWKEKMSV